MSEQTDRLKPLAENPGIDIYEELYELSMRMDAANLDRLRHIERRLTAIESRGGAGKDATLPSGKGDK